MILKKPAATPLALFCLLLLSFAYFHHHEAGWNVNTRLALTFAVVEQGSVAIDYYHANPAMPYLGTGDKAFFEGHYYCDKSPALSFLGVPVYAALWHGKMGLGVGSCGAVFIGFAHQQFTAFASLAAVAIVGSVIADRLARMRRTANAER